MTGRYQQRSGIEAVVNVSNYRHTGLSVSEYTMAEHFRSMGYATGLAGKWHLGYDTAYSPLNHGFDYFKGFVSGNIDYHSHIDQAGIYDWWEGKELIKEEGYSTDLITKASLGFIEANRDKPFFLYVAHEAPHYPFQGRNDPADRTVGGSFPNPGSRSDRKNAYKEMIEAMDEGIGSIMELLEDQNLLSNTIVVFCSDNGAASVGSNEPLRGFKGKLWEGGHRVPAILFWEGRIGGGVCEAPVMSMDLFPTLVSLATGAIPDKQLDGMDFSGIIDGNPVSFRTLHWRFGKQQVVRSGSWKLLVEEDSIYLYNLEDNLDESENLAKLYPARVDSLFQLLYSWNREMESYELKTR
jgi:arylsulfatase A-like enzyme